VSKSLICSHSQFFNDSFNIPGVQLGEIQYIELSKVRLHVFGLFAHWLYEQNLDHVGQNIEAAAEVVNLWVLAERLLVRDLKNATVNVLCGYLGWYADPHLIRTVYSKTAIGSPLRKLIATAYATRSQSTALEMKTAKFNPDIVFDIALCLKDVSPISAEHTLTPEDYYMNPPLSGKEELRRESHVIRSPSIGGGQRAFRESY
jgi:hypothetical protein